MYNNNYPIAYVHSAGTRLTKRRFVVLWVVGCVLFGSVGRNNPSDLFLAPFTPHSGPGGCQGEPENQQQITTSKKTKTEIQQIDKSSVFRMRRDFVKNGRAQRLHVYCCFMKKMVQKV